MVLTVSDLDRAVKLYADGFGLDLHIGDHKGDDPWTSGRHAATTWSDGASCTLHCTKPHPEPSSHSTSAPTGVLTVMLDACAQGEHLIADVAGWYT